MGNDSAIREVQLVELEILKDVAALCDRHNLRYSLYCGTLLGAIRHGGFIPWDDDADLTMPLSDYKKFIKVADELSEKYHIETPYNSKHSIYNWSRVKALGTTYMPALGAAVDVHWGISIDIFPMIGAAQTEFGERVQSGLLQLSHYFRAAEYYKHELKAGYAGTGAMKTAKRLLSIPPYRLLRKISDVLLDLCSKDPENATHIGTVDGVIFKGKFLKDDWAEMTVGTFEGHEFVIPANYDKFLTIMYGDYMTPPPKYAQVPHFSDKGTVIRDVHRDYREYRKELIKRTEKS